MIKIKNLPNNNNNNNTKSDCASLKSNHDDHAFFGVHLVVLHDVYLDEQPFLRDVHTHLKGILVS